MEFDETKFKELIIYISMRSEDDTRFGAVKLNKLLYYSDFRAYISKGTPSREQPINTYRGASPRELLSTRGQMLGVDVRLESRPYFGGTTQERIVPQRPPT